MSYLSIYTAGVNLALIGGR